MTFMIHCQRCGQIHLIGDACRSEALFNKNEEGVVMENKDFKDLLKSIDQARKIHKGKIKAKRVSKFKDGVKDEK